MSEYRSSNIHLVLTSLVCFCLALQSSIGQDGVDIDGIYHRIKVATGEDLSWPELRVLKVPDRIASYSPRQNVIWIDSKAVRICQSLEGASDDAVAFLLAHEVSHFLQKAEVVEYGFSAALADASRSDSTLRRSEELADSKGSFLARQAGYQSSAVVDTLLKVLYHDYRLSKNASSGYPALQARIALSRAAVEYSKTSYDMYRSGLYLMCLGDYSSAIYLFEDVQEWITFTELEYNLGICYLHRYFNLFPSGLRFPLSSESSIPMVRSHDNLTPKELLQRARQHFSLVDRELHSGMGLTKVSLLLIDLVLKRDQQSAIEQARLYAKSDDPLEVCFAANILALLGAESEALAAYRGLQDRGGQHVQFLAADNMHRIKSLPLSKKPGSQRSFTPPKTPANPLVINWEDEKQAKAITFSRGTDTAGLPVSEIKNSHGRKTTFIFKTGIEGKGVEDSAEAFQLAEGDFEITYHTGGYFFISYEAGRIYKFDHDEQLLAVVRFEINP